MSESIENTYLEDQPCNQCPANNYFGLDTENSSDNSNKAKALLNSLFQEDSDEVAFQHQYKNKRNMRLKPETSQHSLSHYNSQEPSNSSYTKEPQEESSDPSVIQDSSQESDTTTNDTQSSETTTVSVYFDEKGPNPKRFELSILLSNRIRPYHVTQETGTGKLKKSPQLRIHYEDIQQVNCNQLTDRNHTQHGINMVVIENNLQNGSMIYNAHSPGMPLDQAAEQTNAQHDLNATIESLERSYCSLCNSYYQASPLDQLAALSSANYQPDGSRAMLVEDQPEIAKKKTGESVLRVQVAQQNSLRNKKITTNHPKNFSKKLIDVYLKLNGITDQQRPDSDYLNWIQDKELRDAASIKEIQSIWKEDSSFARKFRMELCECIRVIGIEEMKVRRSPVANGDAHLVEFCYEKMLMGLKVMIRYLQENDALHSYFPTRFWRYIEFQKISE